MKQSKVRIAKRRKFTTTFKQHIVSEFESGQFSISELSKLHGIASKLIYDWIYKFSTTQTRGYRIVEMSESSTEKLKQLELKVKELEAMVGRKQIQVEFLEKMIDLAEQEYGVDIKKKCSTRPLTGSEAKK